MADDLAITAAPQQLVYIPLRFAGMLYGVAFSIIRAPPVDCSESCDAAGPSTTLGITASAKEEAINGRVARSPSSLVGCPRVLATTSAVLVVEGSALDESSSLGGGLAEETPRAHELF